MRIISNGSKWYGDDPDSITGLLEALDKYTLDPSFEEFGNFYFEPEYLNKAEQPPPGTFTVFGNFYEASHVFNIEGTAEELEPIRQAILKNQASPQYAKVKREISERTERERQEREVRRKNEDEKRLAEAKALLERASKAGADENEL